MAVLALFLVPLLAAGAPDQVAELQAPSVSMSGDLTARAGLGALVVKAPDGRTAGSLFKLEAERLHVELDASTITDAAGLLVQGDVERRTATYSHARLASAASLPGHELLVLPADAAGMKVLAASMLRLEAAPAAEAKAKNYVDADRPTVAGHVPPSVRLAAAPESTIKLRGDLDMVLWSWQFLVEEGDRVDSYRTGYHADEEFDVAGVPVGHGRAAQAYVRAENATLTLLTGDGRDLSLRLLDPTVQGAQQVTVPSAAGRVGADRLVSGEDLVIHGEGLEVRLDRDRPHLLGLSVHGRTGALDASSAGFVPVSVPAWAWWAAAGSLVFLAMLLAPYMGKSEAAGTRRITVADSLIWRGALRSATAVLRLHLRRERDCIAGLTLLATVEERRGRLWPELDVRLQADEFLVDEERRDNCRRVLHLYGQLGLGESALTWFERCREDDPGMVQELLETQSFAVIEENPVLRSRARKILGWDDGTRV